MNDSLSPNTQAILLLTGPLIVGRGKIAADLLTPGQYKRLAQYLREQKRQPSDLLGPDAETLCVDLAAACAPQIARDRLRDLLERGFQLSQAVDRWHARAIWVVSRADAAYPRRLKARLKEDAPAVLYGCGDPRLLDTGGLAVVGSRHVDEALIEFAEGIGRLTAKARRAVVSGAARGIDQAAMRGALEAQGMAVGVLADSLESAVVNRENRNLLLEERLALISPYDPAAGFNVGNAMQRNKVIYALADAALVVSSDHKKGGTWAGAIEQLHKHRAIPVYVRNTADRQQGLDALRAAGALPWPEPAEPEELTALLKTTTNETQTLGPKLTEDALVPLPFAGVEAIPRTPSLAISTGPEPPPPPLGPAEELFATVRTLMARLDGPRTDIEIAAALNVSRPQAKEWLTRLVEEGVLAKSSRPIKYLPAATLPNQQNLFN